ncbi:uncharacterized protein I303_101324 [Kwoniella dejecticola CBS 10117]|uniref:N-acetyl-D-glucosamine kinase n=1 Tax=Kwoniella dejecticola CBS 10117 TaxID=1296121 RepID=A0A1A6AHF5_9TREE|nr:uncharacterized protein I303_01333 [Kwoniella dejecticola CBS 10117]OBR89505.1 hypothetical protein I303_01333 [Kwoniella dejecticola CBS 10117]
MTTRLPTPPPSPSMPRLVLCADGGGSKVCVVIRSHDGVEVRGIAGPCNVQSVGFEAARQSLLLATYRALSQLSSAYIPADLVIPSLPPILLPALPASMGQSSKIPYKLPDLNIPVFQYAWLGLAGIQNDTDANAFLGHAASALAVSPDRIKLSNDVNLLAAPALESEGVDHVVAVVAGTGTIGRTIRVSPKISDNADRRKGKSPSLPLEDVGIARGWGYLLCDEGSAFWLGRLAIRSVLAYADRKSSSAIYSSPHTELSLFHRDFLSYFGIMDPAELINLASTCDVSFKGLDAGQATAKRNALIAGSARVVLKWAFPEDQPISRVSCLPTPPGSTDGEGDIETETESNTGNDEDVEMEITAISEAEIRKIRVIPEQQARSQKEAMRLVRKAIEPLVDLTLECLGDMTVVDTARTALVLGGGLMMSSGYRGMLLNALTKEDVVFRRVILVDDAAGEGARALSSLVFGQ